MDTKVKFTLRSLMQICILVSSLLMVEGQSKNVEVYSVQDFTADNPEETFYHMAVRHNGEVYTSTQKSVYRLADSLDLIRKNDTCSSKDCININKVLVIDYDNNRLVTCGGYEGSCESRSLDELTYNIADSLKMVVSINDLSAIGYIASKPNENYLYVAATDDGQMGNLFYTISIRSLNNFKVFGKNEFRINNNFKNKIQYVSGFSYQEFRYFVANIKERVSGIEEVFPRLSRICNEVHIEHLSDVYLKCVDDTTSYKTIKAVSLGLAGPDLAASLGMNSSDYVLYAVFFNSDSKNSSLCIYKWSDIETAFEDALFGCSTKDSDLYKLNYASQATCNRITIDKNDISDYFCKDISSWSSYSQGTKEEAVVSHAVLVLPSHNLTAVTTVIEKNHTVAFLGTADGHLLKAHLVSNVSARMFEDVTLAEGSTVRSDMFVSVDNKTLLALTENKLFKLRVENCTQYTTCNECIGQEAGKDGDPYCGWCTLERKCTKYDVCSSGPWLPFNEAECVSITQVTPPSLQHSQEPKMLAIQVQNLPPLTDADQYKCIFNNNGRLLDADLTNQTLNCQSPESEVLPPIPAGTDHVSVTLSIFATATGVEFVETLYDFYACNAHHGCSSCVSSEWGCKWCVFKNKCTKHPDEDCAEESIVIDGENENADECPQIVSGQTEELHVNVPVKLSIDTKNIPPTIKNFNCEVNIMNKVKSLPATRDIQNNNTIVCDNEQFVYNEEAQSINATVTILWKMDGGFATLDNVYIVKLYNCSVERPDCSRCLSNITAPPSLQCVWCGPSTGCTVNRLCDDKIYVCPAPRITKIIPSTVATMADITIVDYVTLEGIEFGQDETDIVSVKIGGKKSEVVHGKYEVGKSVMVSAPAFEEPIPREVIMLVRGSNGQNKSSAAFMLNYKSPEINSFSPNLGPLSGGVNVTIYGKLLTTGSEQKVMIGESVCKKWNITGTTICCETTKSNSTGSKDVTVNFSLASRKANNKFEYKKDPNVTRVYPDSSIKSGGRNLTVEGSGFDTIQNPKVIVTVGDQTFEAKCKDMNKTMMVCPTPNVSSPTQEKRVKRQAKGEPAVLGFKFANVDDLLTWSRNSGFQFILYEDPIYYKFNNTKVYGKDVIDGGVFDLSEGTVSVRGEGLNYASKKEDVLVYVGDKECKVNILSSEELQCSAPKSAPNTDRFGAPTKDYPLVTVVHGNLEVIIGPIKYPEIQLWLFVLIGIAGLILLIFVLVVIIHFYHKTKMIEKDKERMLEEMELLEESVREDSRRAIAELTTNLDDLTTELEGTGMPFLSMLDYMKKMMFTGYEQVPADFGSDPQEFYPNAHGLKEFAKLLSKKDFLLSFIEMVEESKNISKKQKGNFASLLTVGMIAEKKLPYFTEVLTSLLEGYISDGVACKRGKLLFRRTESVTEKLLSNWTALCMYDHLKDHAGYPLYLLYQAIKCKVWKGPVDAVTFKSYHSLSIDYLFKDNVDFDEIKLNVSMDKSDEEMFSVSVLTCDCISQVKEKILDAMYKSRPYSSRPSASSVDLDLRAGNQGHLVLSDLDNTSKVTGHWKQLNTLRYLKIKDGATVSLLHRANGRHSVAIGDIVTNTNPLYENTINMNAKYGFCAEDFNIERGVQPWHLVKELDSFDEDHRNSRKRNQGSMYRRKLKTIQEVHFPRLMSTKTTIQKYVDRMFEAILKAPSDDSNLSVPLTIKYLFDFFDKQAEENDVGQVMAKTWKNNSLVQRFWVTVITHPNFIFDILQTLPVEGALSIIAETLLDSCAVEAIKYTKDTSTNRLLYTREVPKYREYVDRFYSSIQKMPTASSNFLNEELECVNEVGNILLYIFNFKFREFFQMEFLEISNMFFILSSV
ncbi:plexin-A4-like isoform X2 [Anneissia japonica]|uniref:plexin-A4-like isoform X2 n=1 Tax=Anneissia japonica TaxID=1529436 RepID=UPI0014254C5A|nr:plexin-A4-like isoform X2 [Anneissia japonica]